MAGTPVPIACTLSPRGAEAQLGEWAALREHVVDRRPVPHGQELSFLIELAPTVEDLAAREAACCSFLTIRTHRDGERVRLVITSADPAAAPVIELLTDDQP